MSEQRAQYDADENIFRVQKTERYFVASNIPFNDERLTWEARGVMGYLLSKPVNWQTRMNDLVHKGPAKMTVIRRILAELRRYGYMKRMRVRVSQGKWAWITTLYESPELNIEYQKTIYRFTVDGSSIDGKPIDVVITDLSINDKEENSKFTKTEVDANAAILIKLYQSNIGVIVPLLSEKLIDAAKTYPSHLYAAAFEAAVAKNARNWAFVEACIRNANDGKDWQPQRTPYTPIAPVPALPNFTGYIDPNEGKYVPNPSRIQF